MLMMRILWASTDCTVTRQGLLMLIMRALWASTDSIFPAGPPAAHDAHLLGLNGLHCHPKEASDAHDAHSLGLN